MEYSLWLNGDCLPKKLGTWLLSLLVIEIHVRSFLFVLISVPLQHYSLRLLAMLCIEVTFPRERGLLCIDQLFWFCMVDQCAQVANTSAAA